MKKMYTVIDDCGEARQDIATAEAMNEMEAAEMLRDQMQDGDETYNYVVIDGQIAQFDGLDGFLGEENPTDEDLTNAELWNIDDACSIWDIEEA